jgi:hypothetical protein
MQDQHEHTNIQDEEYKDMSSDINKEFKNLKRGFRFPLRSDLSVNELQKRISITVGVLAVSVVGAVYLIVLGAIKNSNESQGVFTVSNTPETDNTIPALKQQYVQAEQDFFTLFNRYTLTNPTEPVNAGAIQLANLNVASNYKLAIQKRRKDPTSPYGKQSMTTTEGLHRLINRTIVEKQILPAINGDISSATLTITYKDGKKITLNKSDSQVIRDALLDMQAANIASSHAYFYNFDLVPVLGDLKNAYGRYAASQFKFISATEGTLDPQTVKDICTNITEGISQSWAKIPSVVGKSSTDSACPGLPTTTP